MRTALIDADVVVHLGASAGQREYDFGDGESALAVDDLETLLAIALRNIEGVQRALRADAVIVCFSDPLRRNWRKDVLPTYKGNRTSAKPEMFFPLQEAVSAALPSKSVPGLEGDDVMGILATHPHLVKGEKVIYSIDKDMGQIPGKWLRPGIAPLRTVTREEGERLHYMQMLTGDTVDGYAGIPGVGPKTAAKILDTPLPASEAMEFGDTPWSRVVAAYEARGLSSADALAQARVSKILQWTDFDYKRKEPILWNPPSPA